MTLSAKLSRLKAEHGLTTEALSQRSGVPKGTINKILNGETRNPTVATLSALAEALRCPLSELCGEAAALPEQIPGVQKGPWSNLKNAASLLPVTRKKVPLLGAIAAGRPIFAEETTADAADCDGALRCDFALRVKGDSMVGARILDGDIVFIRRQDDVDDGQIAAVIVEDEATLKRVYHIKNGLQLLSENPKYPPMVFTLEDYASIRILGLAVGFTSRL